MRGREIEETRQVKSHLVRGQGQIMDAQLVKMHLFYVFFTISIIADTIEMYCPLAYHTQCVVKLDNMCNGYIVTSSFREVKKGVQWRRSRQGGRSVWDRNSLWRELWDFICELEQRITKCFFLSDPNTSP